MSDPVSPSVTGPIGREGDLARTAPEHVLAFCERERFSGALHFDAPAGAGQLPLLNGVPEIPEHDRPLARAFEAFLSLGAGRYQLEQLLPDLEGAERMGDTAFMGTLASVSISALLRYCSAVGLSGMVTLSRPDRGVLIRYSRGELASISVNDSADVDLVTLFAWTEGRFEIRARPLFGAGSASVTNLASPLSQIELALGDVLARSATAAGSAPKITAAPSLRGSTKPFGLSPPGPAPQVRPEDEQWEPSPQTSDRLRNYASMPPPANTDAKVTIYKVDRDPTGAYPALRADDGDNAVAPRPSPRYAERPPPSARAIEPPVSRPQSSPDHSLRVALRRAQSVSLGLGALFVLAAILAAYLLGRMSR